MQLQWQKREGMNYEGDQVRSELLVDINDGRVLAEVVCPLDHVGSYSTVFYMPYPYTEERQYIELTPAKVHCESIAHRYFEEEIPRLEKEAALRDSTNRELNQAMADLADTKQRHRGLLERIFGK